MDDGQVFCGKEQILRKLLDAIPNADIIEAQDILVKCDWDVKKAIVIAQKQHRRCSEKALAFIQSYGDSAVQNQGSSADSHPSGCSRKYIDAAVEREIVLDSCEDENLVVLYNSNKEIVLNSSEEENLVVLYNSNKEIVLNSSDDENSFLCNGNEEIVLNDSDEETVVLPNINKKNSLKNSQHVPKRPRVISSSESDEISSSKRTNSFPKPSNSVQKSISFLQQSATPSSYNNDKNYSRSVTIEPGVQPTSIKQSQIVVSSPKNIPNLPKGLVIPSVVGSSPTKQIVTGKKTSESSRSIPSSNKTNGTNCNKLARLVQVKSANKTTNVTTIDNASRSKSLTVRTDPKGVGITSVENVKQQANTSYHANAKSQQSSKNTYKSKSAKGKNKKYVLDDEDDEEYGSDLIYDSEDSGRESEQENITHARSAILKFVEGSSPEDLSCIPECSKKKVDIMFGLKPFGTLQNLEEQDILLKSDSDLKKAITGAQKQPLRCSKKALPFIPSYRDSAIQNQGSSADSHHSGSSRKNIDAAVSREIVVESSDEDNISVLYNSCKEIVLNDSDEETAVLPNINKNNSPENSQQHVLKRPRVISSRESDEYISSKRTNSSPKPSNCVQKSSSFLQQSAPPSSYNNDKNYSQCVIIEPVVHPTSIKQTHVVVSSPNNIPNLPIGLVIPTVVGSSPTKERVTDKKTSESSSSIPSSNNRNSTNSDKLSQLVEIKSANEATNVTTIDNASRSKSLTVRTDPKGVGITPVENVKQQANASNHANVKTQQSPKNTYKSKSAKGKGKKYVLDDEDDEEYGSDLIYDREDSERGLEQENLTHARDAILKFLEESSPEDLCCIPGCSKKKVDIILGLKPFGTWQNLVEKLKSDRYLSTDFLNGAKTFLIMRNAINKLMDKGQQISFDMEELVEKLKTNKESSFDYVGKQPVLLNDRMHLTFYQMLGLNWLLLLHNQEVNGILADETGLGKTIQAIAFFAYLKEISISGPHLIVVPASTMDNWKQELKTWWPNVSVISYHGSQDHRLELRMQILNEEVNKFDFMITTSNMATNSAKDRSFFKRLVFHYVVFDEAHVLRNMSSQSYQHLMKIRASRRLLLTGTPLQNNLIDLSSLLIFAMPNTFPGKTEQIKLILSSVFKNEGEKRACENDIIDRVKRKMKPFVLRRLKKDVLHDLPAKRHHTRMCPMSEDQAKKYKELCEKLSTAVRRKRNKDLSLCVTGMMIELRRAANHPLLLRRFYDVKKLKKIADALLKEPTRNESDPKLVWKDMYLMSDFELHKLCAKYKSVKPYMLSDDIILNSGKFKVLDSLLPTLLEKKNRVLLFSQFTLVLDIIEEYMKIKKYRFIRLDGQTPFQDRLQMFEEFNNDPSVFVFLLSTRTGRLGMNSIAADTVILHDIDFDPYNEKQAEDSHRDGQTRDVIVHRLISENTIEECILQRDKDKSKLARGIHESDDTEENDVASISKLVRDALDLNNNKR